MAFFLTFSGTVDSVGSELEITNLGAVAFVGEVKIDKTDVKRKRKKLSELLSRFVMSIPLSTPKTPIYFEN